MKAIKSHLERGLGQWPLVAAAWLVHGGLLFYLFLSFFVSDKIPFTQKALTCLGLLALLVLEVALLTLLNGLLELVTARLRPKALVDLVKSLALALILGLLTASIFKFMATSIHLKVSDLWFTWANFRQILQEALLAEVLSLLLLPGAVLVLAALLFAASRWSRRRGWRLSVVPFTIVLVVAGAILAFAHSTSPPLQQFSRDFVPEVYWARRLAAPAGVGDDAGAETALAGNPGPPITPYKVEREGEFKNVVLVMMESLPWKRTLGGGGRPGVMPNLEALAAESVVFSRAYTTSTHSDYAQMAILSSLHPRKYDRHDYYVHIEYPRTLIWDALKPAGFTTSMFSCQNERWGNMLNYLNTPDLDVLRHALDWPKEPHRGRGASSKVYERTPVEEWIHWRRSRDVTPYFTYLNFQATHYPYESPPDSPRPFSPHEIDFPVTYLAYPEEKIPVMLNRFENALHYSDQWLGRVVEFLKEEGEWDETILVVVSDHGEAFYEHGFPTHGASLHEEQVRSLLMMRIPGEEPRVIDEPVSLLDVPPTILRLLGLPPHGNFQGRGDILESGYDGSRRPLLFTIQGITFEDGLLLDGWKYTVNWDLGEQRLVELASDPDEKTNLSGEEPDRLKQMDGVLADLLRRQVAYYENRHWQSGRYAAALP